MVKKYILNTQDYTFAHFEHEGFGGIHKYIATPKKKGLPKLLVKHENSYAACSEFFTSRIAELLNIKTPTNYLMSIAPEDKGLFETPFVVGIGYIDDLTGAIPYDHMDDDPSLRFDLINAFALYAMFGVHSDNLQCCYSPSRGIISIDFEQYFGFFEKYKDLFNLSDKDIARTTLDLLDYLKRNSFERDARICSDMLSEKLQIPAEKLYPQFHFSMKRLCKITEKELLPIYDALSEIYPIYAETFFYGYLLILKKKIESYIPDSAHYIPIEQVIASLSDEYLKKEEAFYQNVKSEFGSKGLREAKEMLASICESHRDPAQGLDSLEEILLATHDAIISCKREARKTYTPKKVP